jgi:hypothetical protein
MKASDMTLELFEELRKDASFYALTRSDYCSYAGASDFALIADTVECDILVDGGMYHVYGIDEDEGSWCVTFTFSGEQREEILLLRR